MNRELVIVSSSNQEAIYIKGKLWEQGSSITGEMMFKLGQLFNKVNYADIGRFYLSASQMQQLNWKFPENLEEIPKEFLN
jgi:hypothetical protein